MNIRHQARERLVWLEISSGWLSFSTPDLFVCMAQMEYRSIRQSVQSMGHTNVESESNQKADLTKRIA